MLENGLSYLLIGSLSALGSGLVIAWLTYAVSRSVLLEAMRDVARLRVVINELRTKRITSGGDLPT